MNNGKTPAECRLRVACLIDELQLGGTELQLAALVNGVDRELVQPSLYVLNGRVSESIPVAEDCPVRCLNVSSFARPALLAGLRRFARDLRQSRVDILQLYFADSTYFGHLAGALAGVPNIVRTRRDLVFHSSRWHRAAGGAFDRTLARFFTQAVVCNSRACRDAVVATSSIAPGKIHVISNGVDLSIFASVPVWSPRQNPEPATIGTVSRLSPEKGVGDLLEAFRLVLAGGASARLVIAGGGPAESDLKSKAERLGIGDYVHWYGPVQDIPAFLAGVDLAVLSSLGEGLPNAVIEYMAAGRPIIATDAGGTSELIDHRHNGLLVPPQDPQRLADAITMLLNDPGQAQQLAKAARAASANYSLSHMIAQYEQLYRTLAGGKQGTGTAPLNGKNRDSGNSVLTTAG